jgi:putative toxin-antitoxin system antitoxin component (TIGR02293 family)
MNVATDSPRLWKLALDVFGSEQKATLWLHTRLSELEDHTPAEMLDQAPESTEVEAILERIEYGVFN